MILTSGIALGLDFIGFFNRGNPMSEGLHFLVTKECNLSYFVLLATISASADAVYPGGRPAYWFENRTASAGDHVMVFTTKGLNSTSLRPDGYRDHCFYWGSSAALFGFHGAKVVIAELNRWETKG